MSNLWFYALDNDQHGPLPAEELRALLHTQLPKSTLVWSEGMESWVTADKVKELVASAPPPLQPRFATPPATSQPAIETEAFGNPSTQVHSPPRTATAPPRQPDLSSVQERSRRAWARFLARSADIFLAYFVLSLLFGGAVVTDPQSAFYGPLIMLGLVPLEAWFLSRWGMTPGKWLFRVRIIHQDNRLLTMDEGMRRTMKVMLTGMALGILFLQILFNILAYKEFVGTGTTVWDRLYHSEVQYGNRKPIHTGVMVAVAIFMMIWLATITSAAAV